MSLCFIVVKSFTRTFIEDDAKVQKGIVKITLISLKETVLILNRAHISQKVQTNSFFE